jgi:hypothetical protein
VTTLSAHEVMMLVPEARELWETTYSAMFEDAEILRCSFAAAVATADLAVRTEYSEEAQRRHDAAVRRTLEGG